MSKNPPPVLRMGKYLYKIYNKISPNWERYILWKLNIFYMNVEIDGLESRNWMWTAGLLSLYLLKELEAGPMIVHLVVLLVILCSLIVFIFSLILFYLWLILFTCFTIIHLLLPKLTMVNTSIYFFTMVNHKMSIISVHQSSLGILVLVSFLKISSASVYFTKFGCTRNTCFNSCST